MRYALTQENGVERRLLPARQPGGVREAAARPLGAIDVATGTRPNLGYATMVPFCYRPEVAGSGGPLSIRDKIVVLSSLHPFETSIASRQGAMPVAIRDVHPKAI